MIVGVDAVVAMLQELVAPGEVARRNKLKV